MTFEELDERFANGMDSARIREIIVDYARHELTLKMRIRGNSPDGPNRDDYREAVLKVMGLHYISIDAPDDFDHLSYRNREEIIVDGLPEDPNTFALYEQFGPALQAGAFSCRFFVHDWNSFIHIAGRDARFDWE